MTTDGYTMQWVGWNTSFEKGIQHDKVWGWFIMKNGAAWCFWGARSKKLRFKKHPTAESAKKIMRQKENKKYDFVPPADYDTMVKDFLDDVEIWCMSAILEEKVM